MTTDSRTRRINIILYASAVFFFWMSQYVYVPTLPTYVQSKTTNLSQVGFVLSMYGLWQAIVRVPLSIAADWLGRRKWLIIFGLLLGVLGAWLMGVADNAEWLAVGRAITGAAGGSWTLMVVGFSDMFLPSEAVRATALVSLVNTVGRVFATASTGWLNQAGGYSLAFFVAAGVGALAVVSGLMIRETPRSVKQPTVKSVGALLARRDVLWSSLTSGVSQYANWAFSFGFTPVLAKQMGGDAIAQSAVVTWHLVVFALANYGASKLTHRFSERTMVYASFVSICIGTLIAAFASSLTVVFVAQGFIGLGVGINFPVLMGVSIKKIAANERTTAMGIHQTIFAIGMSLGPALSGIVADAIGLQPMFGVTGFGVLLFGVLGTRIMGD
jgi:MFS transporter, DHA1 family, multidrug resistance protein